MKPKLRNHGGPRGLLPTPGPASRGLQGSSLGEPVNWVRGNREQEEDEKLEGRPEPE